VICEKTSQGKGLIGTLKTADILFSGWIGGKNE